MKKHKGHHHTGSVRHKDMTMHNGSRGMGGKDPDADASHHAANMEQGMGAGLSPMDDSDSMGDGGGKGQSTIPDMDMENNDG